MNQKKIDLNLVPENIKNLANRTSKQNQFVTDQERLMALAQVESIIEYLQKFVENFNK